MVTTTASEADVLQTTTSGHHESRYPIAETLWIGAAIILLLAVGDALTILLLAGAVVGMAAAWWIHRKLEHRVASRGHGMAIIGPFVFAAAAIAAVLTLAAPAQAATVDSRFDICAALRNGTSLSTIESTLEARGYNATNAGTLTGTTIRQHCPDQAAGVMAQLQKAGVAAQP
jgi:predicted PurR-regulated permease PerM